MITKNLNILIVEPSYIVYEGIVSILSKASRIYHFFRANDINEIQKYNLINGIDVVIINPIMVQNQTKHFNSLRKEEPDIKWLGLVYSFFDQKTLDLFDDVVLVNDLPDKIVNTLQKLINSNINTEKIQQQELLSTREIEVLKFLVSGLSIKEIADKLFISTHTIITHRKNISQKTGIKSIAGLTIYAVVNNIVALEEFNQ